MLQFRINLMQINWKEHLITRIRMNLKIFDPQHEQFFQGSTYALMKLIFLGATTSTMQECNNKGHLLICLALWELQSVVKKLYTCPKCQAMGTHQEIFTSTYCTVQYTVHCTPVQFLENACLKSTIQLFKITEFCLELPWCRDARRGVFLTRFWVFIHSFQVFSPFRLDSTRFLLAIIPQVSISSTLQSTVHG